MKFLDEIGLAYFWEKIKDWANSLFFSKRGGYINPETGLQYTIDGEQLSITISGNENETIDIFNVDENRMEAIAIVKTGGTATQVLMADGSVRTLNANNGIAGLDANGNVPLAQLGNLDTTVAEVVTALPTTNIKKHIYLIEDEDGDTQNQYKEYIYTGDTSATYDASKWEKLGDFRATVDLADYAKKSETISNIELLGRIIQGPTLIGLYLHITRSDSNTFNIDLPAVTTYTMGLMFPDDKIKLDGIEKNANNYSLPTASSTIKGGITLGYSQNDKNYPVALDSSGKAYVNVPWTDTNTTYDLSPYAKKSEAIGNFVPELSEEYVALRLYSADEDNNKADVIIDKATNEFAGVMTSSDKIKLDGISSGATADSAIPTSVIDALN